MKTNTKPVAPEIETPAALDVEWLGPLREKAAHAADAWTAREAHTAALRKLDAAAPYVERATGPVEIARAALPGLEAYQAGSAPIRTAARQMGLDIGMSNIVSMADAAGVIRNRKEGLALFEQLAAGCFTDPGPTLGEILQLVKGAENQLDGHNDYGGFKHHLRALVAKMQEVNAAREEHPLPDGPLVEIPVDRPTAPAGSHEAITAFDLFNFGKEN